MHGTQDIQFLCLIQVTGGTFIYKLLEVRQIVYASCNIIKSFWIFVNDT
jgi:hypothetical protein